MTETLAMDCDELVELVTDYLEASLDPETRARVEAHVTACPGCEEILEQFRATIALTGALRPADAAGVEPDRRAELLTRFREWRRSADEP